MFKISARSAYAVKALMYVYGQSREGVFTIKEISEKQNIPYKYLEKIFGRLRREGFVKSVRGPGGGYKVLKKPGSVKLGELIRVLEESSHPVFCLKQSKNGDDCVDSVYCDNLHVCRGINKAVGDLFNKYSIADLLKR